jgi:hypothetical protein
METKNNKYKQGKIYRVTNISYTKFYYGSTVQSLAVRMGGHRESFKRYQKGLVSIRCRVYDLFEEFGVGNCKIELVEAYPCENKCELLKREGFHIEHNECVNKLVAGRSQTDYKKEWYEKNKANILNHRQKLYKEDKDSILQRNKLYRDAHKAQLSEQKKLYYKENKDILHRKVMCSICHSIYTHCCKAKHEQSKKHQQALSQEPEP